MDFRKIYACLGFFSLCFILFLYFFHPITNLVGDLAFYLKTGEIIVKTHTIPTTNLFSYTNPQFPFINPNWLSEVIFYVVQQYFGFAGLIILSTIVGVSAFALLVIYALKKYDIFVTLCIGLVSLQILYERTDVKPELFSYLFLSIFFITLYTYRKRFTKWIFFLIPLELVWVNTHIYFPLGVFVIMVFIIDALVTPKKNIFSPKNKILYAVGGMVVLSTCFNPQGIKGALYPFFVTQNYAFPVEENISFWTAITSAYQDTTFFFFGCLIVLLLLFFIFTIKKVRVVDILLVSFFTTVGFLAVRAFPLFVYGIFIPLTAIMSTHIEKLYSRLGQEKTKIFQIGFFLLLLLILFPTIHFNIQNNEGVGIGVRDDAKDAIRFLQQKNIFGPYYNNFDIGDYIEYALYPKEKVFVDARAEAYPKSFFNTSYFPSQTSPAVFKKIIAYYNIRAAVIAHTDTSDGNTMLIQQLAHNTSWKIVYLNSSIIIFINNSLQSQALQKLPAVTEGTVRIAPKDTDSKQKVRQLANVFRVLGWEKEWLAMSKRYLDFEPKNCGALENVAYILQRENSPSTQHAIQKYIDVCLPHNL